jgi:hypothetical protein
MFSIFDCFLQFVFKLLKYCVTADIKAALVLYFLPTSNKKLLILYTCKTLTLHPVTQTSHKLKEAPEL